MKHLHSKILCLWALVMVAGKGWAQQSYLPSTYRVEAQAGFANEQMPLWLTANRYGLSSVKGSGGYLRVGAFRSTTDDSQRKWRWGYGADVALAYDYTSTFVVQQIYADLEYRRLRLSIGAKEEQMEFKNAELSSGSQALGINARPVPQVRLGLPEYWSITGSSNWAAIKGHVAYGWMTDGDFLEDWGRRSSPHYAKKALYHSKAGYLRIGNEEYFPLVFEGGLEMACLFGGTIYGASGKPLKMDNGIKAYWNAFFGAGNDPNETVYKNAEGNTVGSWVFSLSYKGRDWKVRAYYDHFFEDHSMMFFQYGWKDGLSGLEITLPENPFVGTVVYEYMNTTDQSGPIYHDHTPTIPDQISATDNYYNHGLYTGWQHWGQAIGNPLFISPLYNKNGDMSFTGNRFKAHHVGLSGDPLPRLHYRLLYTYMENWGTYGNPYEDVKRNTSLLVEGRYQFPKGWGATAAFAFDRGTQLGDHTGFQMGLSYKF